MAGHSHWAQVKHKKAVVDARRGKLFAKLIRAVEVAARDAGTSNPDNNMTLAAAFERAKSYSVPTDTIERAAKRGAGEIEGVRYERVLYEGYGPGGGALLVETLTDNRNRTGADMRATFARGAASLGEPGSVAWMFERKGLLLVPGTFAEDDVLAAAAEAGADDVERAGEVWEIVCDAKDLAQVRSALERAAVAVDAAELTMLPNSTVELEQDAVRRLLKLMDTLEDLDDVQNVYTNVDIPEALLAEVS